MTDAGLQETQRANSKRFRLWLRCCFSFLRCLPTADGLQVHAVDEVIRLLRGEGSCLLQPVSNKSEATANHEQQHSSDDEAESQRKDRTFGA